MHPELLSAMVAERHRDLNAAIAGCAPRVRTRTRARTRMRGRAHALSRLGLLPKFRLYWTHTALTAAAGGRSSSSIVIVISATRVG